MSSVSGINGTASAYVAPVTVAPAISTVDTTTSAPVATASTAATPTDTSSLSSAARILSDPLSGVQVQQYLNSQNVVEVQFPSKTVIAYLQNGLTADGFRKTDHVA